MAIRSYKKVGRGSDKRLAPRLDKEAKDAAQVVVDALRGVVSDAFENTMKGIEWLELYPEVVFNIAQDDNFAEAFEIEVFKKLYNHLSFS